MSSPSVVVEADAPPVVVVDEPDKPPTVIVENPGAGTAGPPGPTGPPGATGPKGATGNPGPTGSQGPAGATGPPGATGSTGPQGPQGTTGAMGATGSQGVKGDKGDAGTAGSAGPQGPKGDPGTAGAPGAAGADGDDGAPGATGAQGPTGATGQTGSPGPQGVQGPKGDTGTAGATGAQGPAGATGAASTVPGPTGPQGATGATGSTGATGPAGAAGADGAPGPKGDTGAAGTPGSTGAQGAPGVGVPAGGTTGQTLAKTSSSDYATAWVNETVDVPRDDATAAATRIHANKLLAADAQPAFRFRGDGRIEWGPGGATPVDVNLYRSGVDILGTDDQIQVANRIRAWNGAAGQVVVGGSSGAGSAQIFLGSALDCDITRAGADLITTGDKFDPASFNVPTKAGVPTDTDVVGTAANGDMIVDTTGKVLYVRIAGTWQAVGGGGGSSTPAGAIMQYAGAAAPTGWLLCDGSSQLRATYAALFTAIGVAYGSADGTHFNLPDMRGRVPVGVGPNGNNNTLGQNESADISVRSPYHRHSVADPQHIHTGQGGRFVMEGSAQGNAYIDTSGSSYEVGTTQYAATGITVGPGGYPTDVPAFLVVNHIIKT